MKDDAQNPKIYLSSLFVNGPWNCLLHLNIFYLLFSTSSHYYQQKTNFLVGNNAIMSMRISLLAHSLTILKLGN